MKCSFGSVYNGETKKEIISRSIEHQQKSIKGHPLEQPNTQKNPTAVSTGYTPKTLSMKNSYYDRKVRESLEIDMVVFRYGQDEVLNRDKN